MRPVSSDLIGDDVRFVLQALIEAEASQVIGAVRGATTSA
jgi:hypothetical protein